MAKEEGKHAVAVEAFAKALTQIPLIIAENAGLDSQVRFLNFFEKNSIGSCVFLLS